MKIWLKPINEDVESYYRKAELVITAEGLMLLSYGNPAALYDITNSKMYLMPNWQSSSTTTRHVKEFLKQLGFKAETKRQMEYDYDVWAEPSHRS